MKPEQHNAIRRVFTEAVANLKGTEAKKYENLIHFENGLQEVLFYMKNPAQPSIPKEADKFIQDVCTSAAGLFRYHSISA